jgi:pimeloyl-ACP methyl ester carboxylesterase
VRRCSIADYVDDVDSVADSLSTRPVLIGHSLGGFVVQKYLESRAAPAVVLVASVPPRGSFGFVLRLMRRHPWHVTRAAITGKSLHMFNTPELARESFFSAQTPELKTAWRPVLHHHFGKAKIGRRSPVGREKLLTIWVRRRRGMSTTVASPWPQRGSARRRSSIDFCSAGPIRDN